MALELNGTTGVSAVQAGAVESGDLAAGAIGSSDLPAGSVIQVVQDVDTSSNTATTSTSFITTNTSASITPLSASNKILISISACVDDNNNGRPVLTVFRGNSNIAPNTTANDGLTHFEITTNDRMLSQQSGMFLDPTNTTNQIQYTIRVKSTTGQPIEYRSDIVPATITLMEIAG